MNTKNILYVCSELLPYMPETELSKTSFEVARSLNNAGAQIRIFTPRYGNINERRHQLHEVIRLSGMNLVVNDIDVPLVIKVASIPKERIQVYFIDNDDYFSREAFFTDEEGKLFADNDERAIFFAKGVAETIKKLNWTPDIIHIQGWMSALLPLYLRTYYKDEPIFANSKIVSSFHNDTFEGNLNKKLNQKILFDGIAKEKVKALSTPSFSNLMRIAAEYSDGIIAFGESVSEEFEKIIKKTKKPVLNTCEKQPFEEEHLQFYEKLYE